MTTTFKGTAVADGLAIGPVLLHEAQYRVTERYHIEDTALQAEVQRLEDAFAGVKTHLKGLKRKLRVLPNRDPFLIIEAHEALIEDQSFHAAAIEKVRRQRINAEWALDQTVRDIRKVFEGIEDTYIRDRTQDVVDLRDLVLRHLGAARDILHAGTAMENTVLVARDLLPHSALEAIRAGVKGIVLQGGSPNGHTAIIARSMGVPLVLRVDGLTENLMSGQLVAVDGQSGEIFLSPNPEQCEALRQRFALSRERGGQQWESAAGPTLLKGGTPVAIQANIDLADELQKEKLQVIDGVGLFRTEIAFLGRKLPTEESLVLHYRKVYDAMGDKPLSMRVLDLGGDKVPEGNPEFKVSANALGLRGIRLLFARDDIFRRQVSAILRAAGDRPVSLLLPMVTNLDDVRRARSLIDAVALAVKFPRSRLSIGAMVETPAAAMIVDVLRNECDFLSIGSNDLIQYILAVDRTDERLATVYDPLHPAVLRVLQTIIEQARDTRLNLCGEIAGEPVLVPLLVGLGLRSLSMALPRVPQVKLVLRKVSMRDCRGLAKNALKASTSAEIRALLDVFARRHDLYQEPLSI